MVERFSVKGWNDDHIQFADPDGKWVHYSDYAALEAQIAERVKANRETVAKHVYDAMSWAAVLGPEAATGTVPRWVDGGNSLGQDEARKSADAILSALQAVANIVDDPEPDHEAALSNVTAPDNATSSEVLAYVLFSARLWSPEARIIGNARAGDIVRSLLDITTNSPSRKARWRAFEATTHGWWGIELEHAEDADEPILYPIKVGRVTIDNIVNAHNSALEATPPAPKVTEALTIAHEALEAASAQILESYRTWVADDKDAKPRYGQYPRYDQVNAAIRVVSEALTAAQEAGG